MVQIQLKKIGNLNQINCQIKSDEFKEKEWTLIFYCGGDIKGINDIGNKTIEVIQNLFMKLPIISDLKINVVVQMDGTRALIGCYKATSRFINKFELIEEYDEVNLGDYILLRDFIIRCKTEFPANRYFLYCFGHGCGWRGIFPDYKTNETGNNYDILTMEEIHNALNESGGVDIIAFSNCIMGCVECAYELRNCTDVFIGSEEIVSNFFTPINTWYNILNVLQKNSESSTYEISKKIINRYKKFYWYYWSPGHLILPILNAIGNRNITHIFRPPLFTMSAIRTDKMNELCSAIDEFSELLLKNLSIYKTFIHDIRLETEDFPHKLLTTDPLSMGFRIDVYHFADLMADPLLKIFEPDLFNAAQKIKRCVNMSVIKEWHQIGHPNAHGVGLFFPPKDFTNYPDIYKNYNLDNYMNSTLEFKDNCQWDEFLECYLN